MVTLDFDQVFTTCPRQRYEVSGCKNRAGGSVSVSNSKLVRVQKGLKTGQKTSFLPIINQFGGL